MWNLLVETLSSAYVQLVFLCLFIWYFLRHHKDPRMPVSRIGIVHLIVMALIFIYFLLSWASGIRPALAHAAILGMFIINLLLLRSLILSRLEGTYRDALAAYCQAPRTQENLDAIWSTGKRFYYPRYFFASIMSGSSPTHFIHEIAAGRIRDDIQDSLHQHGYQQKFISLQGMISYLQDRLAREELLPQEFKEVVNKEVRDIQEHPWIVDKINEYLDLALENPEKIRNPEWSQQWEAKTAAKTEENL